MPFAALKSLSLGPAIPREVEDFVARNALEEEVEKVVGLIRESFPEGSTITSEVTSDPEYDRTSLVLEVGIPGGKQVAIDSYRRFVKAWAKLPPPERNLVRVTRRLL